VLVNLIGNAIRYTPEDGCITIRVRCDPTHVQVVVEDTGIGIPAEALPYLFERFYRVDPSRSRASGGSGIGLTIARQGTELEFVIMVIAVSCVKLLSAHNSTQHTSRKHKV
jgi:Signal transduction histidine kinase